MAEEDDAAAAPDAAAAVVIAPAAKARDSWSNPVSFLLACVGYAVGLGNIWRFPYLCYKSGGGAFLIPYLIMLVFCGMPLLFMEISLGQYTRQGPIGAMQKICPILTGAGFATVVISFWLSSYYNVIIAWSMFYLASSFSSPLPWSGCHNEWNTELCWDDNDGNSNNMTKKTISSAQEFYDHRVLGKTDGIEDMGSIRLELLGLLALAWVVVYFCIWKSIKATGKVVYVTATVPYLLLFLFLTRGVVLPGAAKGIRYFFEPRWEKMMEARVWVYAAAQVFNSIGIAFGSLVAFSSYNRFHAPILRNTVIVAAIDAATCIVCGVAVFATMGNLAHERGLDDIEDVVADGPGLVFVVFPHALSKLPAPQVWSVVFFAMLVMLGIDSQFATVEVIITSFSDHCSDAVRKYLRRHEVLVAIVCGVIFLFGIPYIFQGGIYVFQLTDHYGSAVSLMYIAFFETVAIVWIYGVDKLSANIKDMTGVYPGLFLRKCWTYTAPLLILGIWAFNLIDYEAPTYNKGEYVYPGWAHAIGWLIASTSVAAIPAFGLYKLFCCGPHSQMSFFKRLSLSSTSTIAVCPCGCGNCLNGKHEAHDDAQQKEKQSDDDLEFAANDKLLQPEKTAAGLTDYEKV